MFPHRNPEDEDSDEYPEGDQFGNPVRNHLRDPAEIRFRDSVELHFFGVYRYSVGGGSSEEEDDLDDVEVDDESLYGEDPMDDTNELEQPVETKSNFPVDTFIYKAESQQPEFVKDHGKYADGCNVLIAILDTGVDPSLPCLERTSFGARKIVDCIDCSGAGDVDTSVVKSAQNGVVIGLTGRKLNIPEQWVNPTGKWHLGIKPIYELYPKTLRKTVKEDWQKESWESAHQLAKADALRLLLAHEESVGGFSDNVKDKHDRENLACQVDFLKSMDKLEDKGPVADCIVWHDGHNWKACIDTSFRGRLALCHPMGEFRTTGDFSKLSHRDEACYTFRIENNGNRLEICVPSGAHGTHVACIAAAYSKDEPGSSGLAPGAQIVSMMIGDNRIDSMETGTALTRALNLCVEMKVDIVNMSFGEGAHFPASGRIIEEIQRIVYEHNVVFVASAGNSGPALSTVGSPGGTTPGVMGIGARICPDQAEALYGVFNEVKNVLYPWSARGPCVDGALGVSLCAPGAAFAGVPRYSRKAKQMMNGTSMSSPNAAGAIACMISKMRANGYQWNPFRIRLCLENTAKEISDEPFPFGTGRGLLQIKNALDHFENYALYMPNTCLVDIRVRVTNYNRSKRGVYIREFKESREIQEYTVTVEPKFKEFADNLYQADFSVNIVLQSDVDYVQHPSLFMLTSEGRSFTLKVDPTGLRPGGVYYTELRGMHAESFDMGPIFRVPITLVIPETVNEVDCSIDRTFEKVGTIPIRQFIHVPPEATICQVLVEDLSRKPMDRFTLHCVQLEDDKCYRNSESYKILGPDSHEWTKSFPVVGDRTLEVCLVRGWTRSDVEGSVRIFTRFYGVQRYPLVNLVHGSPYTPIRIRAAPFRPVEIKPTISLNTLYVAVKPSTAKIEPLGPRDLMPNGKQIHRLMLVYKFNMLKSCEVRLELPGVTTYLYESPYDCVLMQLFSSSKEFIGASSSYPERYTYKVEKGEYTAHVQVRQPETSQLELLMDSPLHVRVHISPAISLDVTSVPNGGDDAFKWVNKPLAPGQQTTLYAGSISDDKVPKVIQVVGGCILTGSLFVVADTELKQADRSAVSYIFTEYSTRPSKALSMVTLREKKTDSTGQDEKDMNDAIRDTQISWLPKLKDPVAVERLYSELIAKHPTHLPLLLMKMKLLVDKKRSKTETETMNLIIQQILEQCQVEEVLKYFGARQDHNVEQIALKKNMEERKAAIIDCLLARAHTTVESHLKKNDELAATLRKQLIPVFGLSQVKEEEKATKGEKVKEELLSDDSDAESSKTTEEKGDATKPSLKEVDAVYHELLSWVAADDPKVLLLSAKHSIAHAHYGRACSYLQKLIEDMKANSKDTSNIELALIELCETLGWYHIVTRLTNERLVRNRSSYRPF
ncbi:hypothetical protein Y032_0263g583 [Ancylostoma ceylanicum]|uniref:Tripeptidyl-peptidase 2 n=1 Tax=Ancylostoma ceylanicum TaxID=53326 RepID=A0A016S9M7_9BILA|nr:hypothetical protein Y032_0263g583 [Ancylostoma ceylanicum]